AERGRLIAPRHSLRPSTRHTCATQPSSRMRSERNSVDMATEIRIPKLGISMVEGILVEWLVSDGDAVTTGTPIYLIETDKVENQIEAPTAGVIRTIAAAGDT